MKQAFGTTIRPLWVKSRTGKNACIKATKTGVLYITQVK
jgi:hypothetical protein